jgi:hypothetical protein
LAKVPVEDDERLARFVLTERYVPKKGGGVAAQALLPFRYVELSVSRHRDLAKGELWELGRQVARARSEKEGRSFPLVGRADFFARTARNLKLNVTPDEPPRNHANVIGWPTEKSEQMNLAQELADRSDFIRFVPPTDE